MMYRNLALAAVSLPVLCIAQTSPAHVKDDALHASLPIRRVALYKNGVGLFEHAGQVHGDSHVTIDFTTAQLNDVLQSLTAIDLGGGRIAGAGYNSTTPVDEQLRSLPLALDGNATAAAFYNAIRGARVEVSGAGVPMTGRILSMESRAEPTAKADTESDEAAKSPAIERQFLTVISDTGAVRTFPISSKISVRVLDPVLHGDVNRYLQILADNHQQGLRHLTLADNGIGTRDVRVSYISEVPVWKSTYRILFDNRSGSDQKQATVQGWAVVDNTVGADWNNVQLSLIAGEPQSFIQPIAQPFYARRPELDLPEQAQLTPQTHESGVALDSLSAPAQVAKGKPTAGVAGAGMGYGSGGGLGSGSGNGLGPGMGGSSGGGAYRIGGGGAPPPPISYEDSATASIAPQTTTSGYDDFFEYKLTEPVTILKNQSALVPILQAKLDVDPVTLYSVQDNTARRALWLRNTSKLTLDRGSFTVLESGSFSGQGLVDPVHPGERRLLTYAADTAVRVTRDGSDRDTRKLTQVTVSRGVLTEKTREVREAEYLVHNAAAESRTVIVEAQRLRGWELDSEPKPEEITDDLYRFHVEVKSGETVRLHIGQRHTISTRYALLTASQPQMEALLRQQGETANLRATLQPVFDARRHLADLDAQVLANTTETNRILADQERLRKNLEALKGSAEERALARRYTTELNTQEDHLAVLHQEATRLATEREAARIETSAKVEALEINANL